MKRVLVLGSGLVARPLIRYLLDHGFAVNVTSLDVDRAVELIDGHPNGRAGYLDIADAAATRAHVADCDVVASLLPADRHVEVARLCVDAGKHLVTTSYISPEMRALHDSAKGRDVLLLNEMGLDPGIDHMSAMQVIDTERRAGGTLVGFTSWCGGLPAPEANDNPFGYKFSWAPRGVLLAARSSARYRRAGQEIEVPGEKLFLAPEQIEIPGVGTFEGYPNRDSVAYIDTYGFDDRVETMLRGTLRNSGHCALYTQLIELGLLDMEPQRDFAGLTHVDLMESLFGAPLTDTIPAKLGVPAEASPLAALEYIGMLADQPIEIERGGLLDVLADRMMKALTFQPGERDVILMRHDFDFVYGEGRRERITAVLVAYGIPNGDSAMARTVSLPAASAVRMVLEGKITQRGVCIPLEAVIYHPVLTDLATQDIEFAETRVSL